MIAYKILPFYFPSTVVFVDDSTNFLANLGLRLPAEIAFQLHNSPHKALEQLNGIINLSTPVERFFSCFQSGDDIPLTQHVVAINLEKIHQEVYNKSRFEQVSVAVIDYDMPGINGVELSRNIKNPAIKKVLLTGKADEKVAVLAFNEGAIDRFILKNDNDVINILKKTILELQHGYFSCMERILADTLAVRANEFLHDPVFSEIFQKICREQQIVEYYLCSNPEGILMLNAEGEASLLLVFDDETLLSHYEIAEDQGVADELLTALKSNQFVPYFWKTNGNYAPECHNWREFLYPACEIKGNKRYFYSVVKNPAGYKTDTVVSYSKFLENLDRYHTDA